MPAVTVVFISESEKGYCKIICFNFQLTSHWVLQEELSHPNVRILGVEVDATLTEIRAAYKRRALEVHPDKGGTAAAFQRVILGFKGSSFEQIK